MQHSRTDLKIRPSSPHMGGAEVQFVQDAFETNWMAPLRPPVIDFEQDLGTYLYAVLQALKSIAVILDAIGPEDWIYPGHGSPCLKAKRTKTESLLC